MSVVVQVDAKNLTTAILGPGDHPQPEWRRVMFQALVRDYSVIAMDPFLVTSSRLDSVPSAVVYLLKFATREQATFFAMSTELDCREYSNADILGYEPGDAL